MQDNAAPLQQYPEYYLCVPGSGPTSLLATIPTEGADQEVRTETFAADSKEPGDDSQPNDAASPCVQPMRVFNPLPLTEMVRRVLSLL